MAGGNRAAPHIPNIQMYIVFQIFSIHPWDPEGVVLLFFTQPVPRSRVPLELTVPGAHREVSQNGARRAPGVCIGREGGS